MSTSPLIAIGAPNPATLAGTVAGDGWWPDVDCADARAKLRLPDYITGPRLTGAIEGAYLTVARQLGQWRAKMERAGATSLSAITATELAAARAADDPRPLGYAMDDIFGDSWARLPCHHHLRRRPPPDALPSEIADVVVMVNGKTGLMVQWQRAVYYLAMAEVSDEYRDMATISTKQPRVDAIESTGRDYSRMASDAIRYILGTTAVAVDLI